MTYKIVIKNNNHRRVEYVDSVYELKSALSDYRSEGTNVVAIRRLGAKRRLFNLKNLVIQ